MRTQTSSMNHALNVRARWMVGLVTMWLATILCVVASPSTSFAGDPTTDARGHYAEGQRLFGKKDYTGAIKEFSAAERIVPSGYNDFNLGLCYDKLGEADPAISYYRSYLTRVPDASNRALVEASVARLDSALKSAQSKAEAKQAAQAKNDAAKVEAQRKADEAAALAQKQKADEQAKVAFPPTAPTLPAGPPGPPGPPQPESAGGLTGQFQGADPSVAPTYTGDPQLDRVATIDVNAVRAQQPGGFVPDKRNGQNGLAAQSQPPGAAGGIPTPAQAAAQSEDTNETPKPKVTPVYKKWWFWAIVIVGGIIVYDFATSNSSSQPGPVRAQSPTGAPTGAFGASGASAVPIFRF
jgi:hypothetical protein